MGHIRSATSCVKKYKRDYPRIPAHLPVELSMPDGEIIHAITVNLSPAGIQIACDRATVNSILPLSQRRLPKNTRQVEVRLRFPESSGMPHIIDARCTAVFSRRVAENEYRIGLQFQGFEGEDYQKLEHFLDGGFQRVGN
ncbi:MAG: PilZ domain-containing protein [Gammaproteobacteria bacterium]|nr:MAG: PilZ domain-containing protein [Gammaproteobacteria bacterium]